MEGQRTILTGEAAERPHQRYRHQVDQHKQPRAGSEASMAAGGIGVRGQTLHVRDDISGTATTGVPKRLGQARN